MAKTPNEYHRLPGQGRRVEGSRLISVSRSACSLWLGGDHLLLVDRVGYAETYKRFYFRDIQAVTIRKTNNATTTSAVLGLMALVSFVWALNVANLPGRVTLWIIGGGFALITLLNLWRGPTCVTHIKTSVQMEQLPPWNRLRAARQGMGKLRPQLIQAQGAFSPDELKAKLVERLPWLSQNPPAAST